MKEPKIDLLQLMPLLSGLIILMGVTNSVFYYGFFGVDILHYMSFSELIISFLESPLILFIVSVGGVFYLLLTYDGIYSKLQTNPIRQKEISDQLLLNISFWRKALLMLELQLPFFWLGIGYTIFILLQSLFTGNFQIEELVNIWKALIGIGLFTILIKIIGITTIYRKSPILIKNSIWFLFFSLSALYVIAYQAQKNAEYVKQKKGRVNASIIYHDTSRFFPDSFTYFIGKTDNYIFLFHEKDSIAEIIPMSDVKRILYNIKHDNENP
ncbi:MAG TPA: hypothetical protein PKE38_13480 [Ignavibacteriaceae bacterium]|nr:hypothetical protein [Ignavibacteriaceae bacterium]